MPPSTERSDIGPTFGQQAATCWAWARANPLLAAATAVFALTLVWFFCFVKLFTNGTLSTFAWAWSAWNPETNYEHAKLIPLIVLFLVWNARTELAQARVSSSRWGLFFVGLAVFLFLVAARTLQARVALVSVPFLLWGALLYVLGRGVARILLFPAAFLFFMVPLNFLTQATVRLQFLETGAASAICNLIGIGVYTVGTTINAANNAFHFQVDEGCSGIRSLMAIAMLAAIYGHLTQDRLWKKIAIFGAAILFAIIGNAGRLVSIMIVARLFGQEPAGGPYHAISGYLSFPFAIAAMILFSRLLNVNPAAVKRVSIAKETVSYDY